MSKNLEKIRDIKSLINEFYQDELNEGARKSWLVFQQYCDDIKQDLELLEQLKQQRDSLAINNGELCVKVTDLEKENQELLVNKNLAQKLAVEYKNKIDKLEKENQELKDKINYENDKNICEKIYLKGVINDLQQTNEKLLKEKQELKYEYDLVRKKKEKCIDYLCHRNQKLVKAITILESVLDLELENSEEWGKLTYFINSNGGSEIIKSSYELLKEFISEVLE